MKNIFPGYYKKTEKELNEIWEKGIIMFDTNVLLNLYRYSTSTRETILDLITKFSNQIYLPFQAALEYNKNRCEVIAEQEKAYNDFLEKIAQIQKDLQSTNKPPFLSGKVDKKLNEVLGKVSSEVEESISSYSNFLKIDPIYDRLSEIFKEKITEQFSKDELDEIYVEGKKRYEEKIPPGYEDEKNKVDNRKFGDLVLWKQVIKKAKELQKDVIFITDERKSDWWWKLKDGRNMGPRQELVSEIKEIANVDFHMYSSERFLTYGQTFLKEKINQEALKEIEAMKLAEMEILRRERKTKYGNKTRENLLEEFKMMSKQIQELDYVINNMDRDLEAFKEQNYFKYIEGENSESEKINNYRIMIQHRDEFINKRETVLRRINALKKIYNYLSDK